MKVVIIGGGIIGAALAHNLLRAGADVTVIAVGIGATGASLLVGSTPVSTLMRRIFVCAQRVLRRGGGSMCW